MTEAQQAAQRLIAQIPPERIRTHHRKEHVTDLRAKSKLGRAIHAETQRRRDFILANREAMTYDQMADELGITRGAIQRQVRIMSGLTKVARKRGSGKWR